MNIDRLAAILRQAARDEIMPRFRHLDEGMVRTKTSAFDLVTEVSGRPIKTWSDLEQALMDNRGATVPVTYLRPVPVPRALGGLADLAVYESGVAALTPESGAADLQGRTGIEHADLYVAEVPEGSPEWKADLRVGDRIVEVDGVEVTAWSTFTERLFAAPDKPHVITWLRAGQRKSGTIELRREEYLDDVANWARDETCWDLESERYFENKSPKEVRNRQITLLPRSSHHAKTPLYVERM